MCRQSLWGSAFADLRKQATCMIAVIGVCEMRSVALEQTQNAPAADGEISGCRMLSSIAKVCLLLGYPGPLTY